MGHLSLSEQITAELLAILIEEEVTYPWDVTAVESNDPLDVTETPFSLCEGLEATAIEAQAETEDWQSLSEIEQIRRSAAIASQIFRDLSSPE